jgi:hypothetical protein
VLRIEATLGFGEVRIISDVIRQLRKVELVLVLACSTQFAGFLFSRPTQAHRALEQLDQIIWLFPDSAPGENVRDLPGVWEPNWLYRYISQKLESDSTLEALQYHDQWWSVRDPYAPRRRPHVLHVDGLLWTAHHRGTPCRQEQKIEFLFIAWPSNFEAECMQPFEQPATLKEFIDAWRVLDDPLTVYVARGVSSDAVRITWLESKDLRNPLPRRVELTVYRDSFPEEDPDWESTGSGERYPLRVFRGTLVHDTLLRSIIGRSDTSSLFIVNLADYDPDGHISLLVVPVLESRPLVFNRRIAFASVHDVDWARSPSFEAVFPDLTAVAGVLAELKLPALREAVESEAMRTSQRSVEVLGQRLWGVDIARFGGVAILGIQWYFLVQLMLLSSATYGSGSIASDVAWVALSPKWWAQSTVIVANVVVPVVAVALAVCVLWRETGQSRLWSLMLPAGVLISVCVLVKLRSLRPCSVSASGQRGPSGT